MAAQLQYMVAFGPDTSCTLELCPVEASILGYQPVTAANSVFLAVFALSLIVHVVQGIRYRTWGFMASLVAGCLDEIAGYAGRIVLHDNPFSFNGFITQIGKYNTIPTPCSPSMRKTN